MVAIIAILAALLLPGLRKARMRARSITCTSNLHQIHVGISIYAVDANNYAPSLLMGASQVWWTHPASVYTTDYQGNEKVFRCPSAGPPFEWELDWQYTHPRNQYPSPNRWYAADRMAGAYFDYALTVEYGAIDAGSSNWITYYNPPAPLDKHHGDVHPLLPGRLVGTPSSESHLIYDNRNAGPANFESSDTYPGGQEMKSPRHIDGRTANVGYVDGHVAPFKPLVFSGWPPTLPN